ncbi:MAG: DNA polymerase III subunit delta [Nitrospirae bacterium]|nr:DNA polymerase III subunit delta [Nitrospirota bacterium]
MPLLKYNEFVRRMRKGDPVGPLYLFHGEETFLIDEGIRLLREKTLDPAMADFNFDQFQEGVADAVRLMDVAMTYPVLSPMRMVVVSGVDGWPKREVEQITSYLKKSSPTTCLVLTAGKLDVKKNPLIGILEKEGMVVYCPPLLERELGEWIGARIRGAGKTIDPKAVEYWTATVGSDLSRLRQEIDKVLSYVGERKEIALNDVSSVGTGGRSVSTFDFVQALGERDAKAALVMLKKTLESAQPVEVLGVILWNFRRLCLALEQAKDGTSHETAAYRAKVPPFAVKGVIRQMEKFRFSEMPGLFQKFLEADLAIKGGSSLPPDRVLERLVWEVCEEKGDRLLFRSS